jgi:predicted cupin superfamily sugar epimerase
MALTSQFLIHRYSMQPHREGGWYHQHYKSREIIRAAALPERFGGDRFFSTAIYFLLEEGDFSSFHRIKSDECWHFYAGGPLELFIILDGGQLEKIEMGADIERVQSFQYVVPANCLFASAPAPGSQFSLVGCTVAPGFEFADFELADALQLSAIYPQHAVMIKKWCR